MNLTTLVGIFASIFTSTSLLPQLIKIIREKKAENISLWMLAVLFTGLSGWIVYGILKNDWIIIAANSFSLVLNILITVFSIKYKQKL
jgi:MtN3 and saliva related transmembrane protein